MVKERLFTAVRDPNFLVRLFKVKIVSKLLDVLTCDGEVNVLLQENSLRNCIFEKTSFMEKKLMSRKKPSFPVNERFNNYLAKYNRNTKIPVFYDDLLRFSGSIVVYDQHDEDTLARVDALVVDANGRHIEVRLEKEFAGRTGVQQRAGSIALLEVFVGVILYVVVLPEALDRGCRTEVGPDLVGRCRGHESSAHGLRPGRRRGR